MASKQGVAELGPYILRIQSDNLLAPNEIAGEIENLVSTSDNTLRSVVGPVALVDNVFLGSDPPQSFRPSSTDAPKEMSPGPTITYGSPLHGIYHALLQNSERDVLLLHTGPEIWEFTGWNRSWRRLVAERKPAGGISVELINDYQPQFPTQFENTGRGIVIVPQDGRALYYDGYLIAPLGFSEVPGAPQPKGPSDNRTTTDQDSRGQGMNDIGYAHDGTPWDPRRVDYYAGMTKGFGSGRVGTTAELTYDASVFSTASSDKTRLAYQAGWVQRGEYRCRAQFVDSFGNLSAMSPPSSPATISFQPSVIPPKKFNGSTPEPEEVVSVDLLRKQIAWTNISTGPEHCIARNLYRTKDMIGTADTKYYRHTQNTMGMLSDFATLPDNVTTVYPDNVPDQFLIREAQEVVAVPRFNLCRMAFGRLWIAGITGSPDMVRPSLLGKYGTFVQGQELYPDPSGGIITGLARSSQGLLSFTRTGTFLITPSGDSFSSAVLSGQVGCVAPSSIATLDNGTVIWLSNKGFFSYDGTSVSFISPDLTEFFNQVTATRMVQATACYSAASGEYRCWLSHNGSTYNSICLVYTGSGWRKRTDTYAVDVCVTADHRQYVIVAGDVAGGNTVNAVTGETTVSNKSGPYVLDHAPNTDDTTLVSMISKRKFKLETAWMQANEPTARNTVRVVNLWLRETENSKVDITVKRDWRNTVVEQVTTTRYSGADVPAFYSTTPLGTSGATFVRRRPFWTRAQVYVSSSETFKFELSGTGDWEFIGLQVEMSPRDFGGAQLPP